jgi:dTDP-4-dehydrorhamnose reductase
MTDVAPPAAREDTDDGEVVFVKHKLFTYNVPVTDADGNEITVTGKRGDERVKLRTVHKQRFEPIYVEDIPEDELARGEALGAFFTEKELAMVRGQQAVAEAGGVPESGEPGEVPEGLDFDDHDALVAWIRTQKPTAAAVVAAAENDSDKAEALLEAENEATGGQPRKSVKEPLEKIIQGV